MVQTSDKKDFKKTSIQRLSLGRFVYRMPRPALYLTFDDGPHPQYTPALLDVLERYDVRATFFLVGRAVERNGALVERLRASGHTIGLHTHTHKTIDRMTHAEFEAEILANQQAIAARTNFTPTILRPPEGRIDFKSFLWAAIDGLRVVHYTYTSNDWKAQSTEDITRLSDQWPLQGGEILSFHDNNPYTIEAVSHLIERCRSQGLGFAAIGRP